MNTTYDWSQHKGENIIDKVMYYSDFLKEWFTGRDGLKKLMLVIRDYSSHPLQEPDPENLETLFVEDNMMILSDKGGRYHEFPLQNWKYTDKTSL